MTEPTFDHLDSLHTLEGLTVPRIARKLAGDASPEPVWRNDLGGLTFRLGDRFLKWNPRWTGVDLDRERVRLGWIAERHPAPRVVGHGVDGDAQWMLMDAIRGVCAVGDRWRCRRSEAIPAIAAGG
jgi:kanamycin kinase